MAFPLTTVGGGIVLTDSFQQSSSSGFGGGQEARPQASVQARSAYSNASPTGADKVDLLVAERITSDNAGVGMVLNSLVATLLTPFRENAKFDKVRTLVFINRSLVNAVRINFTWTNGPVRGTTPNLILYPSTELTQSFFAFNAPHAAGYDVSATAEADYFTIESLVDDAHAVVDVKIVGISI